MHKASTLHAMQRRGLLHHTSAPHKASYVCSKCIFIAGHMTSIQSHALSVVPHKASYVCSKCIFIAGHMTSVQSHELSVVWMHSFGKELALVRAGFSSEVGGCDEGW